jgi:aminoglycoside 3-N-acetyltransferase I
MRIRCKRITRSETETARRLFNMLTSVFGEPSQPLSENYIKAILRREDFIAIAALDREEVVGGLTAFVLPMTASESSEVFIYDVAVRTEYRRIGVGTRLMTRLFDEAAMSSAIDIFVQADNGDKHALDFYRSLNGSPRSTTEFTFAAKPQ